MHAMVMGTHTSAIDRSQSLDQHARSPYRIQRSSVHFDHDVVRVAQLGVWLLAHL